MAALTCSAVRAQQVEFVPFRSVDDGVVIEFCKTSPRPSPVPISEGEGVSPDALAQDLAGLAPVPTFAPALAPAPIERSAIRVPLWMQNGRASPAGLVAAAAVEPYLYSPAACSIRPYRPRGDLPAYLERKRGVEAADYAACAIG